MEYDTPPLAPIPTTREWYKDFKEIMDEKCRDLDVMTKDKWLWSYDKWETLPFKLYNHWIECAFSTDAELYEFIQGIAFGILFCKDRLAFLVN